MNHEPGSKDWMENLLAQEDYISDSDFSGRVLSALPARRNFGAWRARLLGGAAILAAALAFALLPLARELAASLLNLSRFAPDGNALPLASAAVLAAIAWSIVMAAADAGDAA